MTRIPRVLIAALAIVAACLVFPAGLRADGGSEPPVPDAECKAAIAAFDAAFGDASAADRLSLLGRLAQVRHPKVTDRLHRVAEDEKADAGSRVAALELLCERGRSEKGVDARIGRWLAKESEAMKQAFVKKDLGLPVDSRTGAVRKGPETDLAIQRGQERASVAAAAIRCAAALEWHPKEGVDVMRPFLQSPYDDVPVAALALLGTWRDKSVLPDLLILFRMYPQENRWETSASVDIVGDDATAKAQWMAWFAHPLKQRPRPAVVRALRTAIESICDQRLESPSDLDAYIRAAAQVKKK